MLTGLKNPLVRLITYTGFSRASAEAALETIEPEVAAYQDFIAREHKELLNRVIEGKGIDPEYVKLSWNWGSPEIPEWSVSDVLSLYSNGIIDRSEARTILRELVGLILQSEPTSSSSDAYAYVLWRGKVMNNLSSPKGS